MRYKLLLLVSVFFLCTNTIEGQKNSFKVMAWNILHGGNDIENGPENVAKIIKEINPDIILMVETYGSGPFIANYLNYNFHKRFFPTCWRNNLVLDVKHAHR